MPDHDPKLGRQLPPPPATGREQEVGPGQDTTLANEAKKAAEHLPDPGHPEDAAAEVKPSIGRELYVPFRDMFRGRKGWPMLRLSAAILAVLIGNMVGQVRLDQWNGAFFDAVEERDASAFFDPLLVFLVIVGVLLHAGAVRERAEGRERAVHRASAGTGGVPHPHAAHPQDRRGSRSSGPAGALLRAEAECEMNRPFPAQAAAFLESRRGDHEGPTCRLEAS